MLPLKKMTAIAEDRNIIPIDPFKHYEVEQVQTNRGYLSMEEVQVMIMKKFVKPELEVATHMIESFFLRLRQRGDNRHSICREQRIDN